MIMKSYDTTILMLDTFEKQPDPHTFNVHQFAHSKSYSLVFAFFELVATAAALFFLLPPFTDEEGSSYASSPSSP